MKLYLYALNKQNRRNRSTYFDDFMIEERANMACRWDAKMITYFYADPVGLCRTAIDIQVKKR